jgi:hypothetical protein
MDYNEEKRQVEENRREREREREGRQWSYRWRVSETKNG